MAKKTGQGRPKNKYRTVRSGFRFAESTIHALDTIVESCKEEAPDYAVPTQRMVIEALIHRAKRDFDAGRLSYGELFGVTADAGK